MENWSQLGVGVAAVVALVYVARTLRGTVRDVLVFLGNHLSGVTRALHEVVTNLAHLNEKIDDLHDRVREKEAEK